MNDTSNNAFQKLENLYNRVKATNKPGYMVSKGELVRVVKKQRAKLADADNDIAASKDDPSLLAAAIKERDC
jgi:hypothetical protein